MFSMIIHAMIHAMAACNPVPSDAVCPHGWEPQAGAGGALQFGVGLGLGAMIGLLLVCISVLRVV